MHGVYSYPKSTLIIHFRAISSMVTTTSEQLATLGKEKA